MLYDFIDYEEFFKNKKKVDRLIYTEFDQLLAEKDQFYRKYFFKAYCISNQNISVMAKGLKISRPSVYRYLEEIYGKDYKSLFKKYIEEMKLRIK